MSEYALPMIQLFSGAVRRDLVVFAVTTADPDHGYTKNELAREVDRSHGKVTQALGKRIDDEGGLQAGPLVRFGVYEPTNPDARIAHFHVAESPVMTHLHDCPIEIGDLVSLLETTGRQRMVSYFLDQAGTESYSKAAIERNAGVAYQTVHDQIDQLIKYDIIEPVEGTRGTEYKRNDSTLVSWLRALNELLVESYNQIPATL